ncbi:MAG: hypothetical protein FWD90_09545 [Defluviitaleaceae bacterium]|nr:hypothetical protein [Defluviitaleaceae bacterium]
MNVQLTQCDIRRMFHATRPIPTMEALKYLQFGYIGDACDAVRQYAADHFDISDLKMEWSPVEYTRINNDFKIISLDRDRKNLKILFAAKESRFDERLALARALGVIVLYLLPHKNAQSLIPADSTFAQQAITYFAEKLLLSCADREYGSVLRKKYTGTGLGISGMIKKFCSGYGIKYDEAILSKSNDKTKIDKVFQDVFGNMLIRIETESMLSSDIKLIEQSLHRKASMTSHNKCDIRFHPVGGMGRILGKTNCFDDGFDILFTELSTTKELLTLTGNEGMALSLLRLVWSHELGHIVCHWLPGYTGPLWHGHDKVPLHIEFEATYFARILLEYRELLYNDMKEDYSFYFACGEVNKWINNRYGKYGEPWLKSVLEDEPLLENREIKCDFCDCNSAKYPWCRKSRGENINI